MALRMGGGYTQIYVNLNLTKFSFTHIVFTLFRWCGQIGDTLFIAVSAWFLCDSKKIKVNKIVRMAMDSWMISVIGLFLGLIFLTPTLTEIIKSLFPIRYRMNWFVGCYIIYYLIHPLLNKAVEALNKPAFRNFVVILFVAYSVLGCIQQEYYYTNLVGFICIHYFVMYMKRYMNQEKTIKRDITIICGAVCLILLWIVSVNFCGRYIAFIHNHNLLGCTFINPCIIFLALAALHIAITCKESHCGIVNWITRYSLLIYLIHGSYFWLTYGKYAAIENLSNKGIPLICCTLILIICYAVITLFVSFVYNRLLEGCLEKAANIIAGKLECMSRIPKEK